MSVCCLVLSGCEQIVWTAKVKSPDGKKIVTAKANDNTGPGTDGPGVTIVYLDYGNGRPDEILEFGNVSYPTENAAVGIKWLSPTHLEVSYHKGKQDVDFQAIKYGDVEISIKPI